MFDSPEFDPEYAGIDPVQYQSSIASLIGMMNDRKKLYPHDEYVQLALNHYIADLTREYREIEEAKRVVIPFLIPEEC